jgi:putative transposase
LKRGGPWSQSGPPLLENMSNALAIPATPPPAPRGARWLDVQTAAARLGLDVRQARRLCAEKWAAEGLARMQRPEAGGREAWHVREDADARLARVRHPDLMSFDVGGLTQDQRALLFWRKAVLDAWQKARALGLKAGWPEREATSHFLTTLPANKELTTPRGAKAPGDRTLFRWLRDYRKAGLAGLADERWTRQRDTARPKDDPFFAEVQRLYLDLRQPALTLCFELAKYKAQQEGWALRSYKQCYRYIRKLPKAVVLKYREGEEAFVNDGERYIERDYSPLASNEIWCGDHHRCDVWVSHAGKHVRPWLTAWEDVRSRKIVGWTIYAHDPNTDTILAAFGMGARSHGVCEWVYVDHGADYDSHALQGKTKRQRRRHIEYDEQRAGGVFGSLEVKVMHAQRFHGQSKPIERFFGTMEARFGKLWPTYCGNCPANRPEDLQLRLARGAAPSLEEFAIAFGEWLEADYHARPHTGNAMDGQSPAAVFEQCLTVKRTVPDQMLVVLMWKPSTPLKVGQNGVVWQGLHYGGTDAALFRWLGKEVVVRVDPADVARAVVCEVDGRFICMTRANARLPFKASQAELRKAIAAKQRGRKLLREYYEQRPRLHQDTVGLMVAARSDENRRLAKAEADRREGPPMKPIRTPLDDSLPALQRALESPPIEAPEPVEPRWDLLKEAAFIYEAELEKREAERAEEQSTFEYPWDRLRRQREEAG